MKKKEYNNIFAKMVHLHNIETSPFIKKLKSGSLKINQTRVFVDLKRLEVEDESLGKCYKQRQYFYEYLLMNQFIIQFINQDEFNTCINLLHNSNYKDQSNMIISAHLVYDMIENKKLEIINKLNEVDK